MDQRDEDGRIIHYRGAAESPACASCPCAVSGKPRAPVKAWGAVGGLAIVGEGPSTEEIQQKHPFVGPSGQLLNKTLSRYGIDRNVLWITNALVCPRPKDDSALEKAIACCRPRLEAELQAIGPRAVIALGKSAMRSLQLGTQTMADARGTVQNAPFLPGVPVVTTLHPAVLLRGGAGEATTGGSQKQNMDAQMLFFEADLYKAWRIARGELPPAWSDDIMVVVEPAAFVPEPEPDPLVTVSPEAAAATLAAVVEYFESPDVHVAVGPEVIDEVIARHHEDASPRPPLGPDDPTMPGIVTDPEPTPVPGPEPEAPSLPDEDPTKPGVPPPETPAMVVSAPPHTAVVLGACQHEQRLQRGPVGVECAACGQRAMWQLDGTLGSWFVPSSAPAAPEPMASTPDFGEIGDLASTFLLQNPDVLGTLKDIYKRVGDRDVFIEIVASVASEEIGR